MKKSNTAIWAGYSSLIFFYGKVISLELKKYDEPLKRKEKVQILFK
jgi:hypothetical protein